MNGIIIFKKKSSDHDKTGQEKCGFHIITKKSFREICSNGWLYSLLSTAKLYHFDQCKNPANKRSTGL
jgi:hypothetical protein